MVIEARPRPAATPLQAAAIPDLKPKITVFHCFNALGDNSFLESDDYEVRAVSLPCSSMTREVVLLKAFEAGADAVVVLVCPEGACRHLEGNIRAARRVARVKEILDEIGLDGRRLNLFNIPHNDRSAVNRILEHVSSYLLLLGRSPAAGD